LTGDLRRLDPGRGRFRDYVKASVSHLLADYRRRKSRRSSRPLEEAPEPAAPPLDPADLDPQLLQGLREEVIGRAMTPLARVLDPDGRPMFHTVLQLRADHPEMRSPQLAVALGTRLGRPVSPGAVRVTLSRARERLVDLLIADVIGTFECPTREDVEQELIA